MRGTSAAPSLVRSGRKSPQPRLLDMAAQLVMLGVSLESVLPPYAPQRAGPACVLPGESLKQDCPPEPLLLR